MRINIRINIVKQFALIGLLASVLLSLNLWCGQRYFSKVPAIDGYQGFNGYYDYINIGVLITLLLLSFLETKRYPIVILLLWLVYLCVDDQNRLQPWLLTYALLLFIWLFYKKRVDEPNNYHAVFISMQLVLAGIYIFSGLQKLNSNFVTDTYTWFISPMGNIFSERQMNLFYRFGNVFPYLEILTGFLILFKPLRFIIIPIIIFIHVIILILLSPMGLNHNHVVLPWNLIMIVLNLLLFASVKRERFFDFTILFKTLHFYVVLVLIYILPVFSFNNQYDSYLSSSLYSGNTNQVSISISQNGFYKLPLYVKHFTTQVGEHYKLNLKALAIAELGAPCIPEIRVFKSAINNLKTNYNLLDTEIEFEIIEREKLFFF